MRTSETEEKKRKKKKDEGITVLLYSSVLQDLTYLICFQEKSVTYTALLNRVSTSLRFSQLQMFGIGARQDSACG